jgi:hypothetical protein
VRFTPVRQLPPFGDDKYSLAVSQGKFNRQAHATTAFLSDNQLHPEVDSNLFTGAVPGCAACTRPRNFQAG